MCGEPTIFYMPHCGTALYNNLLWRNWSVDALSKVVIIGNSFGGLEERGAGGAGVNPVLKSPLDRGLGCEMSVWVTLGSRVSFCK